MVLLNDGSKAFAAGADPSKLALGSCSISYRNPDDTAYVKVTYKENIITVRHARKSSKIVGQKKKIIECDLCLGFHG